MNGMAIIPASHQTSVSIPVPKERSNGLLKIPFAKLASRACLVSSPDLEHTKTAVLKRCDLQNQSVDIGMLATNSLSGTVPNLAFLNKRLSPAFLASSRRPSSGAKHDLQKVSRSSASSL
jgi:hypothetical protein